MHLDNWRRRGPQTVSRRVTDTSRGSARSTRSSTETVDAVRIRPQVLNAGELHVSPVANRASRSTASGRRADGRRMSQGASTARCTTSSATLPTWSSSSPSPTPTEDSPRSCATVEPLQTRAAIMDSDSLSCASKADSADLPHDGATSDDFSAGGSTDEDDRPSAWYNPVSVDATGGTDLPFFSPSAPREPPAKSPPRSPDSAGEGRSHPLKLRSASTGKGVACARFHSADNRTRLCSDASTTSDRSDTLESLFRHVVQGSKREEQNAEDLTDIDELIKTELPPHDRQQREASSFEVSASAGADSIVIADRISANRRAAVDRQRRTVHAPPIAASTPAGQVLAYAPLKAKSLLTGHGIAPTGAPQRNRLARPQEGDSIRTERTVTTRELQTKHSDLPKRRDRADAAPHLRPTALRIERPDGHLLDATATDAARWATEVVPAVSPRRPSVGKRTTHRPVPRRLVAARAGVGGSPTVHSPTRPAAVVEQRQPASHRISRAGRLMKNYDGATASTEAPKTDEGSDSEP